MAGTSRERSYYASQWIYCYVGLVYGFAVGSTLLPLWAVLSEKHEPQEPNLLVFGYIASTEPVVVFLVSLFVVPYIDHLPLHYLYTGCGTLGILGATVFALQPSGVDIRVMLVGSLALRGLASGVAVPLARSGLSLLRRNHQRKNGLPLYGLAVCTGYTLGPMVYLVPIANRLPITTLQDVLPTIGGAFSATLWFILVVWAALPLTRPGLFTRDQVHGLVDYHDHRRAPGLGGGLLAARHHHENVALTDPTAGDDDDDDASSTSHVAGETRPDSSMQYGSGPIPDIGLVHATGKLTQARMKASTSGRGWSLPPGSPTVYLCFATIICVVYSMAAFEVIMFPFLVDQFHTGPLASALLLTGFGISLTSGAVAEHVLNRFSTQRRSLYIGLTLITLSSIGYMLVDQVPFLRDNWGLVLIFPFMLGFGIGFLYNPTAALCLKGSPRAAASFWMRTYSALISLGRAVGPILGMAVATESIFYFSTTAIALMAVILTTNVVLVRVFGLPHIA